MKTIVSMSTVSNKAQIAEIKLHLSKIDTANRVANRKYHEERKALEETLARLREKK